MDRRLRWACVGVGRSAATKGGATAIAYAHAEAMKRNADAFELVAGVARHRESMDAFAAEYPCRGYTDMRELYAKERLDGVTVSTFAPDREEHVLAAIAAGVKNVLIEKPLALSMGAALRMKAAAEKAGARLFVSFQRRYGHPFEAVREAVESGRLGELVSIELAQPCPNALDFGPHFINAALFFLGGRKALNVQGAAEGFGTEPWHGMFVEKRMTASVLFEGGVRVGYTANPENRWEAPAIRVNGSEGFAEIWAEKPKGFGSVLRIVTPAGAENPVSDENFHHGDDDRFLYFERCYADLAQVIRTGAPCRVDLEHGLATQRILLGMYMSAQLGRTYSFVEGEPDPEFRFA